MGKLYAVFQDESGEWRGEEFLGYTRPLTEREAQEAMERGVLYKSPDALTAEEVQAEADNEWERFIRRS